MLTKLVAASENECARAAGGVKVRAPFCCCWHPLMAIVVAVTPGCYVCSSGAFGSAGHSKSPKHAVFPLLCDSPSVCQTPVAQWLHIPGRLSSGILSRVTPLPAWCVPCCPMQLPPRTPLMSALLNLLKRLLSAEMAVATAEAAAAGRRKAADTPKDWNCPLCTFVNPWATKACSMCLHARTWGMAIAAGWGGRGSGVGWV